MFLKSRFFRLLVFNTVCLAPSKSLRCFEAAMDDPASTKKSPGDGSGVISGERIKNASGKDHDLTTTAEQISDTLGNSDDKN